MLSITSLNFAIFALLALGVYYLLPRRAQNIWLLLASYAFLALWAWRFAAIAAVMIGFNFLLARRIEKTMANRRRWLWAGITGNVAVLAWFKASGFSVPQMVALLGRFGIQTNIEPLLVLLRL